MGLHGLLRAFKLPTLCFTDNEGEGRVYSFTAKVYVTRSRHLEMKVSEGPRDTFLASRCNRHGPESEKGTSVQRP
jgi:hypothetical protein